jgi:hypothetical protein
MVINKMQKLKIIIALVAVVAIALVAVGLASAQISATQTPNPTTNPWQNTGFWGWMGNCFRFWNNQPTGTQIQPPAVPSQPNNPTAPSPFQGGYGFGRCMVRW